MLTIGVVERINQDRIAIWVEAQSAYTVIELQSTAQIEQGDVMCWRDCSTAGSCNYWNATKGWNAEVSVQARDVALELLGQHLNW
ncbi:hypothetical protein OSW16_16950 [Pseudomonas putida]|uniref:hypothetical protein n=1 Tax=Pseudomonas putida TaxID=303 RepID=UPI00227103E2|nr:hypothetical protein [Pseudomonas putida]WAB96244.1 hypothetical protein OSW16_16950 [Pseudomonas putida]